MARTHEILLLGKKFRLKSPHDDEHLAKLAALVTEKITEVQRKGGAVSTLDAVLMAALNLADEYESLRRESEERLAAIGEKTQGLLAALEEDVAQRAGLVEAPGEIEDPVDESEPVGKVDAR
jgi:cell division protein ZapA